MKDSDHEKRKCQRPTVDRAYIPSGRHSTKQWLNYLTKVTTFNITHSLLHGGLLYSMTRSHGYLVSTSQGYLVSTPVILVGLQVTAVTAPYLRRNAAHLVYYVHPYKLMQLFVPRSRNDINHSIPYN